MKKAISLIAILGSLAWFAKLYADIRISGQGTGQILIQGASTSGGGGGGSGTSVRVEEGGNFVVTSSTFDFNAAQFTASNNSGEALVTIDTNTAGGIMALSTGTNSAGQLLRLDSSADVPDANLSASVSLLGSQIDISAETNLTASNGVTLTDDALSVNWSSAVSRSDVSAAYQPLDATLTDLAAAPLGEADSISVGAIAAGIMPTDVQASSVTAFTITAGNMANGDHGDVSWSGGVATVDNVAAANVAAGALGPNVRASSFPAIVPAGSFTNASITINAQGLVTAASSGAGGSGDNLGSHVATMTVTAGFGISASTGVFTSTVNIKDGYLIVPWGNSLIPSATGQFLMRNDQDRIVSWSGSGVSGGIPISTGIAIPLKESKNWTMYQPDELFLISSTAPFINISTAVYPSGVNVTRIQVDLSTNTVTCNYGLYKASTTINSTLTLIDAITLTNSASREEVTITDSYVPGGYQIFATINNCVAAYAKWTVEFYARY